MSPSVFTAFYKSVRNFSVLISFVLLSLGATPARAQDEAERFARAYEGIDAFIAQHMKEVGTPGISLAITSREGLLRVQTYALADIKTRRAVTPETLFEIGSISKSFTAICLLQLHEAGKIDIQQPVTKYLPWFNVETKYAPITVHHLLTHTFGLPRDRDDIPSSPYQTAALNERETGYAPGTNWAYSNICASRYERANLSRCLPTEAPKCWCRCRPENCSPAKSRRRRDSASKAWRAGKLYA